MSLLSDLGTKIGTLLKGHDDRITTLENTPTGSSLDAGGTIDGDLVVNGSVTSVDGFNKVLFNLGNDSSTTYRVIKLQFPDDAGSGSNREYFFEIYGNGHIGSGTNIVFKYDMIISRRTNYSTGSWTHIVKRVDGLNNIKELQFFYKNETYRRDYYIVLPEAYSTVSIMTSYNKNGGHLRTLDDMTVSTVSTNDSAYMSTNGLTQFYKTDITSTGVNNASIAFSAKSALGGNTGTSGIIAFNNILYNAGNAWSGTRFTAPQAGLYQFNCVLLSRSGAYIRTDIFVNGGSSYYRTESTQSASNYQQAATSQAIYLNAGDYVEFSSGSYNTYAGDYDFCSGYLIG